MAMVGPEAPSPIDTMTLGRFGSLAVTLVSSLRAVHQSATNCMTARSSPEGLGIEIRSLAILTIFSRSTRPVQPLTATLVPSKPNVRVDPNVRDARNAKRSRRRQLRPQLRLQNSPACRADRVR